MSKIHLKDITQEKRKYIFERFFSGFDKPPVDEKVERKNRYVRTVKELNITGTDDPTYVYEPIDDWNVKLTLTI